MGNKIKYEISDHAKARMEIRKIAMEDVVNCLENPGQVIPAKEERGVYQSKISPNGRMRLIRLVVEKKEGILIVVTVYITNKISKYWKGG